MMGLGSWFSEDSADDIRREDARATQFADDVEAWLADPQEDDVDEVATDQ